MDFNLQFSHMKCLLIISIGCHWCFQENDPTLMGRVKKSDAREMQSFYQHYYKKYIQALQNAADKADRWVFINYSSFFPIGRCNCVNEWSLVEMF